MEKEVKPSKLENYQIEIKEGDYAGKSIKLLNVLACNEPACACSNLYWKENLDIRFDVSVKQAFLNEGEDKKDELTNSIEQLLSEEDWTMLKEFFDTHKGILIEMSKPEKTPIDFPKDEIKDLRDGQTLPFNDLFVHSIKPIFEYEGKTYKVFDSYCVNPDCDCRHAHLEVVEVEKIEGVFLGILDYDKNVLELESVFNRDYPYQKIFEQLKVDVIEGKKIASMYRTRHQKSRTIFKDFLIRKNLFKGSRIIQPAISNSIGRNDLCYCGSGKKYKNCHGA